MIFTIKNLIAGLMVLLCITLANNIFSLADGTINYLERSGSHVAFPEVKSWCNKEVLAFREGNTHAADKGIIRIVLNPLGESKVLSLKDKNYDLRNPYFHHNAKGLFIYVTVFDYINHEFKGTKEIQIFDSKCDLELKEVSRLDNIIYAPKNSSLASFSNFSKNIVSIFDEKIFLTSPDMSLQTRVFDEEISFFNGDKLNSIYGIGRNQKDVGKPLLIYKQKNNKQLEFKSWCGEISDSALVSPKVYIFDNHYYVSYSSRRLFDGINVDSNENAIGIHWSSFSSESSLINCRPIHSYSIYFQADIDGGYQTYNPETDRMFFYARLFEQNKFNIFYINDFLKGLNNFSE